VILAVLSCVAGAILPWLRGLATVARALPFFVVAALVANTGLHLRIMDDSSRLNAANIRPTLPLLTAALPAPPVLSAAVFVCLPVLWASGRWPS
jgi:hypothetical protein